MGDQNNLRANPYHTDTTVDEISQPKASRIVVRISYSNTKTLWPEYFQTYRGGDRSNHRFRRENFRTIH